MRRWVAALLAAPAEDREAIVESIEARIAEMYLDTDAAPDVEVTVVPRPAKASRSRA